MAIATGIFIALYSVSKALLDDYFTYSTFVVDREREYMTSLQAYVNEHNIPATDSWALKKWALANGITILTVSRDRVLFYDNSYTGNAPLAETDSLQIQKTYQFFYKIYFSDGVADVYLHKNFQKNYYLIAIIVSAGISALIWALFLFWRVNAKIKYMQLLQREITGMQSGEFQKSFTEKGNDELTSLSHALNEFQNSLAESRQKEMEQKKEQETLVLGMAHDLRTPLTGLLGFLEICRRSNDQNNSQIYLQKAIDKTTQIRCLSDKLFDYLLSNEDGPCPMEKPAKAKYLLGDQLSEFCSQLSMLGFSLESNALEWFPVLLEFNMDFFNRILNNLISNIEKYADINHPISLFSKLSKGENDNKYFVLTISNWIKKENAEVQGTHIGTQNISKMMIKMNGYCKINCDNDIYRISLFFPVILP